MEFMKYKYYDSPEGQDVFKKMFYTSKEASKAGKWCHNSLAMVSGDLIY